MIVIVSGPRDFYPDEETIERALHNFKEHLFSEDTEISKIIQGGASGVDSCVRLYCFRRKFPCYTYDAAWPKHGRKAGPIRNAKMAEDGDALLVIKRKGAETPGTNSMILTMEKRGKPFYIEEVEA